MITSILVAAGTLPTLMIRIEGDGFLRFAKNNQIYYARQAKLTATNQGLMTGDGSILIPRLVAPNGTSKLEATMDGTITAQVGTVKKQLGRFVLAIFDQKTSFAKAGNYVTTSVKPTLTNPGEWIAGVIRTTPLVAKNTTTPQQTNQASKPQTAANTFYKPSAEITVNPNSEIETEKIFLGSIAQIDGDPELTEKLKVVDFGRSPIYGSKRGLTTIHVKATIAAAGIDVRKLKITVPEGAFVERKSQKIEPSAINEAVEAAIKAKFGFEAKVQEKSKMVSYSVPIGKLTYDVSQLNLTNTDISGIVDLAVDGKISNSIRVSYSLPTLSMIKRGDTVRLRLVSNAARVEVNAKATSNGYLGQLISVQTDNGTVHSGTLIGPNTVEVKL
jgi:hypothetical protein